MSFPRPTDNASHSLSVTVFADKGRSATYGHLCYVAGLLLGELHIGTIYHFLAWSFQKSKHPVRSIFSAKILAAGEAIDEGRILAAKLTLILGLHVPLHVERDSQDPLASVSTNRNSVERSIQAECNYIRFEFERRNVARIIWVPNKLDLADPATKSVSTLCTPLQLTLLDVRLDHSFEAATPSDADHPSARATISEREVNR